jgi:uncharacterized coiled-coil DUF342 family protein
MTQFPEAFAGHPLLIVLALMLTALLIVVMGAVTWSFDLRLGRLPQATAWEDLNQRLVALGGEFAQKKAELQEVVRQIQERDHVSAEVAVLKNQLDDLRLELSGLDEGRKQVEEVKRKAAEVATEYAETSGKLDERRRELAEAEERRSQLVGEHDRMTREVAAAQDQITRLRAEADPLRTELATLAREVAQLREERNKFLASLSEAQDLVRKIDAMRQEVAHLQSKKELAESAVEDAKRRLVDMQRTADSLQADVIEAKRLSKSVPELEARKANLEEKIADLRNLIDQNGGTTAGGAVLPASEALADLRLMPSCLMRLRGSDRATEPEGAAIEAVCLWLENLGLRYSRRVVRAFHTALKINETAQMTVLAGVSGTGKSLLPRRYAEAMGIAFLQIAVEPRWDSPQDLLGFYNYVEQRYRATELARALVQMDPFNTSDLAEEPLSDRMLLVLLDEMNLARVEYYFSEFLSRLEVRPPYAEVSDPAKRRDASMPIDIRGRQEGPVHLFPSYNVLFAGTMNDDESTQALSDKVLDRGNVMQFPAPQTFAVRDESARRPAPVGYRRFSEWRSWIRPLSSLPDADRAKTEDVVGKLAGIMERFGRPFGHRLNDAILNYVANYPRQPAQPVDDPLADQIEFRILPKLRGVPIVEARAEFDELGSIIGTELRDETFAQRLTDLVERQERGSGQFSWRGLDRG